MSKIIVVASGKGGVGKTTSAINLAAALNSFDEDVIVVDANLTTPNVGLHLGAPVVPVALNHVLSGKADLVDTIYEHESGTKVIPSSLSISESKKTDHTKLKEIAKKLKGVSDFIIFDCSAGLGKETMAVLEAADDVIVITNPEMPSVTDTLKTIKIAEEMGKNIIGAIITRHKRSKATMSIKNIKEMLEIPILGVVPEDEKVQESLSMKNPVFHTHPHSRAAKSYKKIAATLIGRPLKELERPQNFLERILFNIGLKRYP